MFYTYIQGQGRLTHQFARFSIAKSQLRCHFFSEFEFLPIKLGYKPASDLKSVWRFPSKILPENKIKSKVRPEEPSMLHQKRKSAFFGAKTGQKTKSDPHIESTDF
jgi:hypothetical protein